MRWFVHVDMDAFYVSCELRERPELVGKAVAVGPDPHRGPTRGVVLSASYEARALGIRSAMPVGRAAELAPELIWIPPDFSKYVRSSSAIHDFLSRNAEGVTMRSIDEASFPKESESADELRAWARQTQSALRSELGLPCSIGAAPFRIVAKIASDRAKPGGVVVVDPQGVAEFLAPLPVEAIPGVGPKTSEALQALGIRTIGEIGGRTGASLRRAFGGFGVELLALARGEPHEPSSEGTS
ncbi:MAG TPA: DNA polymerase IV, partial [Thermoplasmata archaeon]|nr:DNA polymerase IV [Thermoplasmata archaeon]